MYIHDSDQCPHCGHQMHGTPIKLIQALDRLAAVVREAGLADDQADAQPDSLSAALTLDRGRPMEDLREQAEEAVRDARERLAELSEQAGRTDLKVAYALGRADAVSERIGNVLRRYPPR